MWVIQEEQRRALSEQPESSGLEPGTSRALVAVKSVLGRLLTIALTVPRYAIGFLELSTYTSAGI
jgi:hypothetical protein